MFSESVKEALGEALAQIAEAAAQGDQDFAVLYGEIMSGKTLLVPHTLFHSIDVTGDSTSKFFEQSISTIVDGVTNVTKGRTESGQFIYPFGLSVVGKSGGANDFDSDAKIAAASLKSLETLDNGLENGKISFKVNNTSWIDERPLSDHVQQANTNTKEGYADTPGLRVIKPQSRIEVEIDQAYSAPADTLIGVRLHVIKTVPSGV